MEHIDQHILELFILGSEKVQSRRAEIESHLRECHGCRDLVKQMEGTYRAVEARFRDLEEQPEAKRGVVERVRPKPAARYESAAAPAQNCRPVTRFQRVQYLVRRHPVIVGSSAFGVLAALALLFNPLRNSHTLTDTNPVGSHLNPAQNTLEILNRHHEVIWPLRVNAKEIDAANWIGNQLRSNHTVVADLDGDGVNEVITVLRPSDSSDDDGVVLWAYRSSGDEFLGVPWKEPVMYGSVPYHSSFSARALLVGHFGGEGETEVLLAMSNARSPNAILRISPRGVILGSYWHYGAPTRVVPGRSSSGREA